METTNSSMQWATFWLVLMMGSSLLGDELATIERGANQQTVALQQRDPLHRGNSGANVRFVFSRNERLKALSEFYRNYNNGQYWQEFKNEMKAMVQKGGGGLDPNMFK